jgi:membrane-bound serine protease (ClpP class)
MSLVIGTILAFTFLEGIWRYLAIIPLALFEVFEIYLWLKLRNLRSITGTEALIGARARVIKDCDPVGSVRVKGQLWTATCPAGAHSGEDVTITGVDRLRLTVERIERPAR